MTAVAEPRNLWTYEDLGLLLGSTLPCLLISSLLARLGRWTAPSIFSGDAAQALM